MPIALHNAVDDDESSEASYRRITPAEFAKLDPNTVTLQPTLHRASHSRSAS